VPPDERKGCAFPGGFEKFGRLRLPF